MLLYIFVATNAFFQDYLDKKKENWKKKRIYLKLIFFIKSLMSI